MQVLVYMAVVSKDADAWPWFGLGQAALAELALGRENPDATDLRAVQRAMAPLLDAGAVTVDRAGSARSDGNSTARYRLNLTDQADEARRKWADTPDGKRRVRDTRLKGSHPTKNGNDTRRFSSAHPTESDRTPDGNRRTKEKEKTKRSEKTKEEDLDLSAPVTVACDAASVRTAPIFDMKTRRPLTRAQEAVLEAQASVAARKAAHAAAQQPPAGTEVS
jgi:hypothetical protein